MPPSAEKVSGATIVGFDQWRRRAAGRRRRPSSEPHFTNVRPIWPSGPVS